MIPPLAHLARILHHNYWELKAASKIKKLKAEGSKESPPVIWDNTPYETSEEWIRFYFKDKNPFLSFPLSAL
jgi:hypothetical protein